MCCNYVKCEKIDSGDNLIILYRVIYHSIKKPDVSTIIYYIGTLTIRMGVLVLAINKNYFIFLSIHHYNINLCLHSFII